MGNSSPRFLPPRECLVLSCLPCCTLRSSLSCPHIAQRKLSTVNRRHGRSAHADGSRSARHIMHTSRSPTAHAVEAAAAHFIERRGVGQRLGRSVDEIGACSVYAPGFSSERHVFFTPTPPHVAVRVVPVSRFVTFIVSPPNSTRVSFLSRVLLLGRRIPCPLFSGVSFLYFFHTHTPRARFGARSSLFLVL